MIAVAHRWIRVRDGEHRFLAPLFEALGVPELEVWTDQGTGTLDRSACGGHIHAVATVSGRRLALTWSDFRVHSATYSREVSRRFVAFVRYLDAERIPLIYVVNSGGVSLVEGRTVFSESFEMWPTLLEYAERNLFLTCAVRRCLGLAPVLFGLGHYRVAVSDRTQINLAGPQVHQMFFRDTTDFDQAAAAERFLERTGLVHELFDSTTDATRRLVDLALGRSCVPAAMVTPTHADAPCADATRALLAGLVDVEPLELAPGWRGAMRLFLGSFRGRQLGWFVNPLGQVDNMISARCLEKYEAGLDLFGRLGVPIVSVLDSPGMDPRYAESDADNIRKMLRVGERIIRYPHGSMGVVSGRCFGGATTLAFPKVFGGSRVVALRGARLGPMQETLIARLLEQSPRLLAQWRENLSQQGPDLNDLLEQGSLDAVVDPSELPAELARFLADLERRPAATPSRLAAYMNGAA